MHSATRKTIVRSLLVIIIAQAINNFSSPNRVFTANADPINQKGRRVDLYTQKLPFSGKGYNQSSDAFSPTETVILYANVTREGLPLQNLYVSFEVFGPVNIIENLTFAHISQTDSSGIASWTFEIPWPCEDAETIVFGNWRALASVTIDEETVEDRLPFQVDWIVSIVSLETIDGDFQPETYFGRGGELGVEMVLKNIAMTSREVTLYLLILDELKVPVSSAEIMNFQLQPKAVPIRIFLRMQIPKWAYVGNATLEAMILTATTPPRFKSFQITGQNPIQVALDDVAVKEVICQPKTVQPGQLVDVQVVVRNEGTEVESFNLTVTQDSTLIGNASVTSLHPYRQESFNFIWNTTGFPEGNYTITASVPPVPGEGYLEDNSLSTYVELRKQPPEARVDVAVTNVWTNTTEVYAGEPVKISVRVRNKGDTTESFMVKIYRDAAEIERLLVETLSPGNSRTLTSVWNTAGMEPGTYLISAEIPPLPEEYNLANNQYTNGEVHIREGAPPTPVRDIAVIHLAPNTTQAYPGQTVNITVVVRNNGEIAESFKLDLYYNHRRIRSFYIIDLPPHHNKTLNAIWNTSLIPPGCYLLRGNATILPGETNIHNNLHINGVVQIKPPPPPTKRDVAVLNICPHPTQAYQGEEISIQTLVENQGDQSENFNLTVGYNNETIQTLQITSLPPHQVYTLTLVWNTTEVSVGNYTLKAWAPPVPGEIDLADNQHVDGKIQILTPIIPNIAILDVTPNTTQTYIGQPVNITITVGNQGDLTQSFEAQIYADEIRIETLTILNLPAHQNRSLTSIWNTEGLEEGNYTLRANATILPGEINVQDNQFIDGVVTLRSVPVLAGPRGILTLLLLFLLAMLITSLLLVIIYLRKKREEEEEATF